MQVLHVLSSLERRHGGPVAALVGLASAQAQAGLDVSVLATYTAGADLSAAEQLRRNVARVELVGPCTRFMSRHPALAATTDRLVGGSDVVHIHAMWEDVQHRAATAAQRRGVPYVIRPCGMLDPWSFSHSVWRKRLYMAWRMRRNLHRAAAVHFASETERDVTRIHRLPTPTIVEPNGVDLSEYVDLPPRGTFRQKHPQIGDRPLVVFLGRIHPGKGVEYLIPAMAKLSTRAAVLAVVGPDEKDFQREMEALAARLGVTDRVVFAGMLSGADKVAALADADVFSLPSNHENFGVVVAEALAAGTPVVVSDQVYIHKDITSAGVGAAVPLDVDVLARELDRWLTDEGLRRGAAARARPFVWEHYSWTKIAARWVTHYERLIGARATTSAAARV